MWRDRRSQAAGLLESCARKNHSKLQSCLLDDMLAPNQTQYNPHISALIDQAGQDWGSPEANRENLVPYGIIPLDRALYGIDTINGEMILILGEHKKRKTTLILNILTNIFTREKGKKPITNVDTLESGMPPGRYRDSLISIVASRFLIQRGHKPGACPICHAKLCKELNITPEFLRYNTRSRIQLESIDYALETIRDWPLLIHGANPVQGDTRNLETSVRGVKSRWRRLIHDEGVELLVSDHVQQYEVGGNPYATDYEKQIYAVGSSAEVVARENIALFLISQVSLTSIRAGKMSAAGGNKGAQEANVVLSTDYIPGSGRIKISILESRRSDTLELWQAIDDRSGAFYGEASKHYSTTTESESDPGLFDPPF